jgi:hypothetical protein
MNKTKAFILCVLVSAIAYAWQVSAIHFKSHGAFPGDIVGFLVVSFGIGLLSASVIAIPVLYALEKLKMRTISAYLIGGSLSMGIVVTIANNFRPLQHPEGFIIGALAGILFWALTAPKQTSL